MRSRDRVPTPADPGGTPVPSLTDVVAQALERIEREGPAALEALCRAHPGMASALRERVEELRAIGLIGAPPKDAPLPERLGGFRVLSRLGGGGMGVVLLAEQEGLARRVALKLVRPDLLYFPGARERFAREVEAVARLAHPGIVRVYAGGEDAGIPYYAMEHVPGASLEELLAALAGRDPARLSGADLQRALATLVRRREQTAADAAPPGGSGTRGASAATPSPTPSPTAPERTPSRGARGSGSRAAADSLFAGSWAEVCLRIGAQVARALQHAHEQGVLHRDVKPSNVMLTPDGRVLLLDFGLAAAEGSERITSSGAALGSLAWMSPEQARGQHATLDARTDVYSLGATLYELLTLRSPFTGGDPAATRVRILQGRVIPLRDLNPSVSRDAETVCRHAMAVERERRYPDAAAFADDLDAARTLRPVAARRPGPLLELRRWSQRNPAAAVAALLAVLLGVGAPTGYGVMQARAASEQRRLNRELGRSRADLALSLADAVRQREAAERGYQRTLDAVDQLLWEVGANDLENVPGFEDTRLALLERAATFYRELATEQPGDAVPRREHLRTQRSLGDVLHQLGRLPEALATYESVVAGLRELVAQAPDDRELEHMLAGALHQVGVVEQAAGRLEAARAAYEEALARLDALAGAADAHPSWLRDQVVASINLARLANDEGDDEQERRLYLRAADAARRLTEAHPDSVDYAVHLAGALKGAATAGLALGHAEESERLHRAAYEALVRLQPDHPRDRGLRDELVESANNFGLMLLSHADRAEALAVLTRGLDAARSLATEFPRDPLYTRNAAVLGINVAAELGNQKRFDEAVGIIEESCAALARLVSESPDDLQGAYFLGVALAVASGMHLQLGDVARAQEEAEESVRRVRAMRTALPGSNEVGSQLASALFQQADVLRATGRLRDAQAACEEAAALGGRRPDILFQGAEIAGHIAADARDRFDRGDADAHGAARVPDPALAARAEALCLILLDEAVAKGFADRARLRDAVFATLQGVAAFEAIVERTGPTEP